jgi:hypothetical protein
VLPLSRAAADSHGVVRLCYPLPRPSDRRASPHQLRLGSLLLCGLVRRWRSAVESHRIWTELFVLIVISHSQQSIPPKSACANPVIEMIQILRSQILSFLRVHRASEWIHCPYLTARCFLRLAVRLVRWVAERWPSPARCHRI